MNWLVLVALVAGVAQAYFAFLELRQWGVDFVAKQTRGWEGPVKDAINAFRRRGELNPPHTESELTEVCVSWAKPLATNLGVYNLMIALALFWTAIAGWQGQPIAVSLGVALGLFLLGAGLAARATGVPRAFIAQGSLGIALCIAALLARTPPG
ncbi:MAG: DUF1304 family protein [Geminicoccaceae bacterium]